LEELISFCWSWTWILDHFSTSFIIAEERILGDWHFMYSHWPIFVTVAEIWNYWGRQDSECTTF